MQFILYVSSAVWVDFALADARRFLDFRRERLGESDEIVTVQIGQELNAEAGFSVSLSGIWTLAYLPDDPKPPSPLTELPSSPSSHSTDS